MRNERTRKTNAQAACGKTAAPALPLAALARPLLHAVKVMPPHLLPCSHVLRSFCGAPTPGTFPACSARWLLSGLSHQTAPVTTTPVVTTTPTVTGSIQSSAQGSGGASVAGGTAVDGATGTSISSGTAQVGFPGQPDRRGRGARHAGPKACISLFCALLQPALPSCS